VTVFAQSMTVLDIDRDILNAIMRAAIDAQQRMHIDPSASDHESWVDAALHSLQSDAMEQGMRGIEVMR
jgi:hypothetical protein